ncbi:MAG: SDR family oxidoreductase [Pseudomonadota bacterium]
MDHIKGLSIVITGASRGIGAAAASWLALKGAKVTLAARSEDEIHALADAISQDGGTAIATACDVGDYDSLRGAISQAEAAFGPVDVLVNNAGIIDPITRFEDSDPSDWSRVITINLLGVYHGMRAVLPGMKARGKGTIINISSGAATGALEGWSHYCASKAGALALTRCGDKEMSAHGVTVVGLSPGTVATDMQHEIKSSGVNPVSQLDWSDHIPPEDVAQAIGYLCGPGAAAHAGTDLRLRDAEARAEVGLAPRD